MSDSTPELALTFRGLNLREELVFKSILRLVTATTLHRWRYEASSAVDLCVLGHHTEADGLPEVRFAECACAILHLDPPGPHDSQHLYTPLRANEIVRHLDMFGERLSGMTAAPVPGSGVVTGIADVFVNAGQANESGKKAECRMYTLRRWPQTAWLMGDLRRLKLATVLTGAPRSLEGAAQRCGLPEALCAVLLSEMRQAGLLHESGSADSRNPAPPENPVAQLQPSLDAWGLPPGRLGRWAMDNPVPGSSSNAATSATLPLAESSKTAVGNGIVDRIRRRLKLGFFSVSLV